jgi:FG-GAP-like repeat
MYVMNKTRHNSYFPAFYVAVLYSLAIFLVSCTEYHRNKSHANVPLSSIKNGAKLAKIYCRSCHQFPDPSLLNSKSWENGVLPEMGPRLGILEFNYKIYPRIRDQYIGDNFYPSQPLMSTSQWQDILNYYEATSPDSMPAQNRPVAIEMGLPFFKAILPDINYLKPATCYVKINSSDTAEPIVISDALKRNIYFINRNLKIADSITGTGPVVDISYLKDHMLACDIGVLNPNNGKFGKGELININTNGSHSKDTSFILDSLERPVQIIPVDLNKDGKTDYLVCEFGFMIGQLAWYENMGNNQFKRHILRDVPGAIKIYIDDYNHDGLPDIWALFAQGDEGIFLFTNKGNGQFSQEEVLKFPPIYGSSYFELDDFNKDGYPDILYTCGDNADYSKVLKPYHGVYIFMNDGHNHFTQKYFFPINGCYKAIARDFEGNGKLDIATISFFADYVHQPEESFVFLKNRGNFDFQPYSLSAATIGRWLTMDVGDIDGDGKPDIILGNFSIGPTNLPHKTDWTKSPPFLILKNTSK